MGRKSGKPMSVHRISRNKRTIFAREVKIMRNPALSNTENFQEHILQEPSHFVLEYVGNDTFVETTENALDDASFENSEEDLCSPRLEEIEVGYGVSIEENASDSQNNRSTESLDESGEPVNLEENAENCGNQNSEVEADLSSDSLSDLEK